MRLIAQMPWILVSIIIVNYQMMISRKNNSKSFSKSKGKINLRKLYQNFFRGLPLRALKRSAKIILNKIHNMKMKSLVVHSIFRIIFLIGKMLRLIK